MSTRFGIPGLVEIDVDDKGFSASTPVGSLRADANGVTVGSNVGGVSVGKDGVRVDSPVGGIEIGTDRVSVTTPGGGISIGSDGTVTVSRGGDGATGSIPGAGDIGLPVPTLKITPLEIPIPVPKFTTQPLEIPLPVPRFSTERLDLPLTVPGFGLPESIPGWPFGASSTFPDVVMTPGPGGPIPIPYPNIAAVMASLGQWSALVKPVGGISVPGLPAPLPWLDPPAPWVPQVCRAVAHTVTVWKYGTHVQGGTLNAGVGTLPPGTLRSDVDFQSTLQARLTAEGVPAGLAVAVAKTLAGAWDGWFSRFTGTLLYPAFVAFPGPQAPPMPCIPVPLIAAGASPGWSDLTPAALEQAFRAALGTKVTPDGERASRQVARWFTEKFVRFCILTNVALVTGEGPVPGYAPWAVPVGPVVGGKMSSGRGILVGPDVFSELLPVG